MSNENDNPIYSFKNHWDEHDDGYWEFTCEELNEIFPKAIYSMSSKAFDWSRDMACRVVNGNGEKLLSVPFDATFRIYKHDGYWTVKIYFHNSPMGDLFTIRKHKTEKDAETYLKGLGHLI